MSYDRIVMASKNLTLEVSGDVVDDGSDEDEADAETSSSLMCGEVSNSPRLTDRHVPVHGYQQRHPDRHRLCR